MASVRKTLDYRRHTVIAVPTASGWQARAFRNKKPVTITRHHADQASAVDAVRADLDTLAAIEQAARGETGYPTAGHFRAAFDVARARASNGQLSMLYAHLEAPDHVLTATQLSAAAGQIGHEYANLHYGRLARTIAEEMDFTPEQTRTDGSTIWTYGLAIGADEVPGQPTSDPEVAGEWRWRLRPEVVEALTMPEVGR